MVGWYLFQCYKMNGADRENMGLIERKKNDFVPVMGTYVLRTGRKMQTMFGEVGIIESCHRFPSNLLWEHVSPARRLVRCMRGLMKGVHQGIYLFAHHNTYILPRDP